MAATEEFLEREQRVDMRKKCLFNIRVFRALDDHRMVQLLFQTHSV